MDAPLNFQSNSAKFPLNLLIVDDDPLLHQSLKQLSLEDWKLVHLEQKPKVWNAQSPHAALIDMHLSLASAANGVADGIKLIAEIKQQFPDAEIIAMSGSANLELMEKALDAGASRFFTKPLSSDLLQKQLLKIQNLWRLKFYNQSTQKFIAASPASQNVLKQIAQYKNDPNPILIEGETGCGKEMVSDLLNAQEHPRKLLKVHIAAIPENIFEAELFGYTKGAFTGADASKMGLIEAASGGDLFLDEIEALSLNQQVKLLRFLENGEYRRLGSTNTLYASCRVILASNQPLQKLVNEGKFREDLYFRISAKKIMIPPLRDRREDIVILAKHFLICKSEYEKKTLSPEAQQELEAHSWPGNVRELRRLCESLRLISPLPVIRAIDLQMKSTPLALTFSSSMPTHSTTSSQSATLEIAMNEFEAWYIKKALAEHAEIDVAAHSLGISRSNLYKKMKDYGL